VSSESLVNNFFRHEYGRLVSSLSRRVGLEHIEIVEDSVQSALLQGLESWSQNNLPDNPVGWLYRVATNNLLGLLRQNVNHYRILSRHSQEIVTELETRLENTTDSDNSDERDSDLLRLLFVCCDHKIPSESQLVFALKSLCGFSVREIALRLFSTEANIYKRYSRARLVLKNVPKESWELSGEKLDQQVAAVHKVIYLLFTEGYLSVNNEFSIRLELCEDAIRLASLLAKYSEAKLSETHALLALMHLQLGRFGARQNDSGGLLLLEEQDRTCWDQQRIAVGMSWLGRSASGSIFSRFHAEAGVAAEHCLAPSFQETRWDRIAECYALLEQKSPSIIHRLNRAIVVAEWKGTEAGLAVLDGFEPPSWLLRSHLWFAVLAELNFRNGNFEVAYACREDAARLAPTKAVRELLLRRYELLNTRKEEDI